VALAIVATIGIGVAVGPLRTGPADGFAQGAVVFRTDGESTWRVALDGSAARVVEGSWSASPADGPSVAAAVSRGVCRTDPVPVGNPWHVRGTPSRRLKSSIDQWLE